LAENVITVYLDLLDSQRKAVFAVLDGLSEEEIWQRPTPKEWCKDPDVLGNIYAYDPAIGVVNLITGLKVGIDHGQWHYDDLFKLAPSLQAGG
jgi:hypothetical protein